MSVHGLVGDALIRAGVVDAAGLARALEAQAKKPATLGRTLAGLGLAEEAVVARTVALAMRLEFLGGDPPTVASEVTALLPIEFCRKRGAFPLGFDGNRLRVAVSDPQDYSVLQDVEFRTGKRIVAVVVTQTWLEGVLAGAPQPGIDRYDMLDGLEPVGELEAAAEAEIVLVDPATLARDTKLPPIVRLVNRILSDAAAAGASDIHIEPQENLLQVRQRVDGLLREVLTVPQQLKDQTISRLKIISGMDIAERRKPQDGRSRLSFQGRRIDLRVSTLPTQFGEKVVIRLLNSDRGILPIDKLGLSADNLKILRSSLARTQGMILVTGPTGSGKTSTLYTALQSIKSPTNNIITLEDPIELQLPGVNQTQINIKGGVTFANGLRSILRQDPNVILVGEIRDGETAGIALQAAQTGHLLLSTLHTNDAAASITRLFDLGVQPFMVASSLAAIVAQRLVRRVCASCAVAQEPSPEIVARLGAGFRLPPDARWTAGRGCESCSQSGMKGRLAIHEILPVDDDVRAMIASRASEQEIKAAARRAGMRTLLEDGIEKAAEGLTTLEEVLRVVSLETQIDGATRLPESAPQQLSSPVSPTAQQLSSPVSPAPIFDSGAPGEATSEPPRRRRVLIVEDSPTIVEVVKYFLQNEGFDVLVAGDGRVGLEMALQELPDVIVTDVNMPAMTGVEMVKALRGDPRGFNVRILMLTSEASVESETEGFEAGADDYILKPVEPRRLAARVKALMGRSRTRAA